MPDTSSIDQRSPLKDAFLADVPTDALGALFKTILQSHKDAADHCYSTFSPPRAKDLSGHYRRAKVEDEWVAVPVRFKTSMQAATTPYKRYTGFYVELTCGRVKLTQCSVSHYNYFPRDAEFRAALAKSSHQYGLFAKNGEELPEPDGKFVYAIVVHGVHPKAKKREQCSFAWVRFPRSDCKRYYTDKIDLFETFPQIVAEFQPTQDQQDVNVKITPKRKKKAVGE